MILKKKFLGFTLAEILIVVGIIGIIAELTIPVIVNNIQKQTYIAQLQKTYTTFNQALVQIAADAGCTGDLACTGIFDSGATAATVGSAIVKYFKVSKDCGLTQNLGCMSDNVNANFDGTGAFSSRDSGTWPYYRFITNDGTSIDIVFDGSCLSCSQNKSSGVTGNLTQTCTWVYFDINGPTKGPNYMGRDIFEFWISNGKGPLLYPQGGKDDANSGWWKSGGGGCGGNGNKAGFMCAARIIEEGWQMNY